VITMRADGADKFMRDFRSASTEVRRAVIREADDTMLHARRVTIQYCPVKSERLRTSYRTRRDTVQLLFDLYTEVKYAPDVVFGTKAHWIYSKKGKVLAWPIRTASGRVSMRAGKAHMAFAWYVRHPGTRARPHLRPGFLNATAGYMDRLKKAVESIKEGGV